MPEIIFLTTSKAPPMGIGQLRKSLTAQGIQSGLISFDEKFNKLTRKGQENWTREGKNFVQEVEKELKKMDLEKKGVKFFGMTMFDSLDQKVELDLVRMIKRIYPKITLIGGGPAFTSNPRGFFAQGKFDYAIRGEAENALPKLIRAIKQKRNIEDVEGLVYRKSGKIITKPITLLSSEQIQKETMPIGGHSKAAMTYTERGCPRACIFCTVPRKGKPVQLELNEIMRGLKQLARNPEIKWVSFMDDQLLHDRKRAIKLFRLINESGLNKRFNFAASVSVDSLLKNGAVDRELINWLTRARVRQVFVGTEAFNTPMLRELKGGRYTKEQAIELNHALMGKKISVENYALAAGIDTRARDFIEAYYNLQTIGQRRFNLSNQIGLVQAIKGTSIHETAVRENALFNQRGKRTQPVRDRQTGVRFVAPKEPLLAELFSKQLKSGYSTLTLADLDKVIQLARTAGKTDLLAAKYVKKLLKLKGKLISEINSTHTITSHFYTDRVERELAKRGLKFSEENAKKLLKNQNMDSNMIRQADKMTIAYKKQKSRIEQKRGLERLRAIQRMRHRLGQGMTLTVLRKK